MTAAELVSSSSGLWVDLYVAAAALAASGVYALVRAVRGHR